MDEVEMLRGQVRRGPWASGTDLNNVFAQRDAISTIPGGVAQDIAVTPEASRYSNTLVRNGDFSALPPDPASNINDITNKLPDWSLTTVAGTSITAKAVADGSAANGYVIRFTCASGNANDEVTLTQVCPVASSRRRAWTAFVHGYFLAPSAATANLQHTVTAQYLKVDGSATGSSASRTFAFSAGDKDNMAAIGNIPADATDLLITISVKRVTTSATTATIDLCDTNIDRGTDNVLIADDSTPANEPSYLSKSGGVARWNGDYTDARPAVLLDTATDTMRVVGEPYGARAVRTANQSISNATDTSINFNATDGWDALSMHDTVTNNARIVIPKRGYYMVSGGVEWEASGAGDRGCWIEVNGVDGAGTKAYPYSRHPASAGLESAQNVTVFLDLSLSDYVSLTVRQNSGGAINVQEAVLVVQLLTAQS